MTALRFHSTFTALAPLPTFSIEMIKNEPMFFSADSDFVKEHGGPITRRFLASMPSDWIAARDLIWDSRSHMLMPGWYPCIPGWHLDDIPRTRPDGQPDHVNPPSTAPIT
jgi:hypothetical protein